jgi:hypothetical protein
MPYAIIDIAVAPYLPLVFVFYRLWSDAL